jgi:protein O-GlcNAc transferase
MSRGVTSTNRVLLTGASGFVGRQTIGPLLDRGHEVHAVGNTVTDPRARWYRADLLDQAARRQLVTAVRPQALLHCAWVTQPGHYWTSPANLDWVAASLDLARLAVEQGTRRVLVTGSCAEYDWNAAGAEPWREDDTCRPASLYGTAKDALHRLVAAYAQQQGVELVWARLFHLYGPHEAPVRLIPSLLAALREGRRAQIGPGAVMRDFMHVADAGRALAHMLAAGISGVINVASGEPVTLGTIARIAADVAVRPDLLAVSSGQSAGPPAIVADTTRLRASGFVPSVALKDGIAAMWRHGLPGSVGLSNPLGSVGLSNPLGSVGLADPAASPTDKAARVGHGGVDAHGAGYDKAARLFRANQREAAQAAAEAVLAEQPYHAPALNLLGVLHRQRGDFIRARDCLEQAAALDPGSEMAWINLGNVYLDMEAAEEAVAVYTRGLAASPARTDTLRLLGNALARAGRDDEAMARFGEAVAAAPERAASLRDRGRAHFAAGRVENALADLDAALELRPGDAELLLIKAQMLRLSGHHKPAAALLRELLAQAPDNPDVHLALGDALLSEERREAANEHYARAVALRPDDHTQGKLCWSLLNSRHGNEAAHISEAAGLARRMVGRGVVHPSSAHAVQSALLRVADLQTLAEFDALFPDRNVLLDYWVRRNVVGALHAQLGRVRTMQDRMTLVDCHRLWGQRYEAKPLPLRTGHAPPGSRIRVGFVSSDLRHHPVSYFALPIFDHYDRERFELFAYSFHPGAPDAVQRQIAGRIAGFRRMPNMPERDIARRIADDRLDILFELGGSTHLNRLEVMAHQPAPIQVSWLGYPHSSGLSRIGYILVDPYLKPPDPRLLLERPFEMPSSWVSLGRLGFANQPILPGLPEDRAGRLTFGTMNNPYKYSPDAVALWARVLHRVPGSRFLIVRPESGVATFRDNIARAFAQFGIGAERVAHVAIRGRHMAYYNEIDIALDTLPQTGGTTTCEALWMGVPTVSLVGPAFFERLSFSNLANSGLGDLATGTPDEYVDTAVALAADQERRRGLRQGLRDTIRRMPIGETQAWVRDFEALIVRTVESASATVSKAV